MKARGFIALMVLSIILVATFACCPGETLPPGVTVEGIVEDAIATDAELDTCQFDMYTTMDMRMTMLGETIEFTMIMDAEGAIDEPNEKIYMGMDMIMEITGEADMEMSTKMYLVEDWMYMYIQGEEPEWLKAPVEVGDWEEIDIASLQIDWLSDAEVEFLRTETVDGTECYVLELSPDLGKLWALMQPVGAGEVLPPGLDLEDVITDFAVKQWIAKDTYFTLKTTVNLTMVLTPESLGIPPELVGDLDASADMAATITMHHINEPVTIELPPEAEDAVEVPEL